MTIESILKRFYEIRTTYINSRKEREFDYDEIKYLVIKDIQRARKILAEEFTCFLSVPNYVQNIIIELFILNDLVLDKYIKDIYSAFKMNNKSKLMKIIDNLPQKIKKYKDHILTVFIQQDYVV